MEQGSSILEKEETEMMNVKEVALAIEWFKAKGLTDADISSFLTFIATGVGLPEKEQTDEAKETN